MSCSLSKVSSLAFGLVLLHSDLQPCRFIRVSRAEVSPGILFRHLRMLPAASGSVCFSRKQCPGSFSLFLAGKARWVQLPALGHSLAALSMQLLGSLGASLYCNKVEIITRCSVSWRCLLSACGVNRPHRLHLNRKERRHREVSP